MVVIWLAFFLSGIAGLSYELTWLRYLVNVFGASTPAVSATVAIFFVGLATGSTFGGWFFDRIRRPLLAYALLEAVIGSVALLVPTLFGLAEAFLANAGYAPGLFRLLAVSTVVLIVPTTLLGATFPAMASVVRHLPNPTHGTGFFYGFNTLGAVLGCVVVSFWCLPVLGQQSTIHLMSGVNAFTAGLCLVTCFLLIRGRAPSSVDRPVEAPSEHTEKMALSLPVALLIAAASGFLAIGIEVMWTRALALSFPASVYVFALVLAAFLVGIGIGSIVVGWVHRRRSAQVKTLQFLYVLVSLGTILTLTLFPKLHFWGLERLHAGASASWAGNITWLGGVAVLVMLPATVAMGAALPLLIGLATGTRRDKGRVAGRLYGANTAAGVAGSLTVTFLLMPVLTLSRTLIMLATGYLLLAVIIGWVDRAKRTVTVGLAALVFGLGLVSAFGLYPEVNPQRFRPDQDLLFYRDAESGTVAIYEDEAGVRSLRVNNYYGLSNTHPDTLTMQYTLGHLPMLLHEEPERALLIGFATGTTLAAMAQQPNVHVDCVELHSLVFELAPYFAAANHRVWQNPRVQLISDDGRRFLSRRGDAYDVIVGDLYLPRNPGVGALYSSEHFEAVRNRLDDDGLFVAWLPLFQLGPDEVAIIIRTFLDVFPRAEGWVGSWSQQAPVLGLVGTVSDPLDPPDDLSSQLFSRLILSIETSGSEAHLAPLASPRLLTAEMLRMWAGQAPRNHLEHPIVEYSVPRTAFNARITGVPLSVLNFQRIAELRPMENTPWSISDRGP